jgi:hypothetical protein
LSAVSAAGCYRAAGATLGVFLGGVILVGLLVAPLVLAENSWRTRVAVVSVIVLPFWTAWLVATVWSQVHVREWGATCVVLAAYAVALAGLAAGLRLTRLSAVACAAAVTVIGLAWVTWPIYMSRAWNGSASAGGIAPFVALNPALVINGQVFRGLGLWTEQSVAYHLTDLSQNVPYTLGGILACVLFHGVIGGVLLTVSAVCGAAVPATIEAGGTPAPQSGSVGASPSLGAD